MVEEDLRVEQVLLELLGSLGPGEAALLGAIIGSLTAYGFREIEEVRRRRRELRGLLSFLNLETSLNEELIQGGIDNSVR